MGLLTTGVGSLPKPAALRKARWLYQEEEIDAARLREAEVEALRWAVQLQEESGLDLPTDGEMPRGDLVAHYAGVLDGMEPGGLVRCHDNRYVRRPRVVAEIARRGPFAVEPWKTAQGFTSRPLRAALTGPYTLMHWSFDEHYDSREACCRAFAAAIREEAEALVEAGAAEIQIDEPAAGTRADEWALVEETLAQVTEPLRARARAWSTLAFAAPAPDLARLVRLPVDVVMLGLTGSTLEAFESLDGWPPELALAAGVVGGPGEEPDDAETVRGRVERILRVVPAERLILTPERGLRDLSVEAARRRLRAVVETAGG